MRIVFWVFFIWDVTFAGIDAKFAWEYAAKGDIFWLFFAILTFAMVFFAIRSWDAIQRERLIKK